VRRESPRAGDEEELRPHDTRAVDVSLEVRGSSSLRGSAALRRVGPGRFFGVASGDRSRDQSAPSEPARRPRRTSRWSFRRRSTGLPRRRCQRLARIPLDRRARRRGFGGCFPRAGRDEFKTSSKQFPFGSISGVAFNSRCPRKPRTDVGICRMTVSGPTDAYDHRTVVRPEETWSQDNVSVHGVCFPATDETWRLNNSWRWTYS